MRRGECGDEKSMWPGVYRVGLCRRSFGIGGGGLRKISRIVRQKRERTDGTTPKTDGDSKIARGGTMKKIDRPWLAVGVGLFVLFFSYTLFQNQEAAKEQRLTSRPVIRAARDIAAGTLLD